MGAKIKLGPRCLGSFGVTVRRLTSDDDPAPVLALLHRAFAGMEGRINPPSSLHKLTEDAIRQHAQSGEVWVIGDSACIFLTPKPDEYPTELYLGKLAVDPAMQGKGLARDLITLAYERAVSLGLEKLVLQTRVELIENHRFFRHMGFEKTKETAHDGFDRPTSFRFEMPVLKSR